MKMKHHTIDLVEPVDLDNVFVGEWKPIDTAPPEGRLILYAPPENLYEHPEGKDSEIVVRRKADYCWATHWMPLPNPPENT